MLSAASCNKWWMDEIIGTKDYAGEQEKITKLGENHVFFLPYLMGERSPHNNPDARGKMCIRDRLSAVSMRTLSMRARVFTMRTVP